MNKPFLLLTLTLAPAIASAEQLSSGGNWYIGTDLNLSSADKTKTSGTSSAHISYKQAVGVGDLKIGYQPEALTTADSAVRIEAELAGRSHKMESIQQGAVTTKPKADLNMGALMLNAYYDEKIDAPFTPFVGVGVGVGSAAFHKNPGLNITEKKAQNNSLAGQITTGISYQPQSMPRIKVSLAYNVFAMQSPEFKSTTGRVKIDSPVVNSIQFGLKYSF